MAYELLDMLGEFSIDGEHSYAETLNVLMLVMGLACDGVQVPEMVALSEFQTVLKLVKKHRKRLGPKATARELITEMHLDHRKDRKR